MVRITVENTLIPNKTHRETTISEKIFVINTREAFSGQLYTLKQYIAYSKYMNSLHYEIRSILDKTGDTPALTILIAGKGERPAAFPALGCEQSKSQVVACFISCYFSFIEPDKQPYPCNHGQQSMQNVVAGDFFIHQLILLVRFTFHAEAVHFIYLYRDH